MSPVPRARAHVLMEATYRQLLDRRPNVAVLPWGATEAHNFHLPHGTDVIEAETIAKEGWKWISVAVDFPYGHASGMRELEGKPVDL